MDHVEVMICITPPPTIDHLSRTMYLFFSPCYIGHSSSPSFEPTFNNTPKAVFHRVYKRFWSRWCQNNRRKLLYAPQQRVRVRGAPCYYLRVVVPGYLYYASHSQDSENNYKVKRKPWRGDQHQPLEKQIPPNLFNPSLLSYI